MVSSEDELTFTNCGVDMFGTFLIKEGRKELKRYGTLFACLSSRAVHIECTCSLETDSFIQAQRRFVARRGNISVLRSDNGSNFVGAQKELEKAYKEMVQITLIGTGTPLHWAIWGCLGKTNSVGTYNTDVFIAHTRKISKQWINEDTSGRDRSNCKL